MTARLRSSVLDRKFRAAVHLGILRASVLFIDKSVILI